MNQKIALVAYLALLMTIFLDSGRVVIALKIDWANNEIMTLSKLETENDYKMDREDRNTFEMSEAEGSTYLETFTITPQNQTIQMKSKYDKVLIDKSKNVMLLENGPQRALKVTGGHNASMINERGSLWAHYDSSGIGCRQESFEVLFERGNLNFTTNMIQIFYDQFAETIRIIAEEEDATIDLARHITRKYSNKKGFRFLNQTSSDDSNSESFVIRHDDVGLKINLVRKPYGLVLHSLHANITRTSSDVKLDCEVGNATIKLTQEGKAKKIVLTNGVELNTEQDQIELYENSALIRGPNNRVVIRKAPEEETTLWLKTMLANITMAPKSLGKFQAPETMLQALPNYLTTTILLDTRNIVIRKTFDWTDNEIMGLNITKSGNGYRMNWKDKETFELSEAEGSSYLETFTIRPQNQTIQMKSKYDKVLIDKSKNVMLLENGPQRALKVTGVHNALVTNEHGSLLAYYNRKLFGCRQDSLQFWFDNGNMLFTMERILIHYNQETNIVRVKDALIDCTAFMKRRKIRIGWSSDEKESVQFNTQTASGHIYFRRDVIAIQYNDIRLTINLPNKPYELVLHSLHVKLNRKRWDVKLDCKVGTVTMELGNFGSVEKIVLTNNLGLMAEQDQIELYENSALIRGSDNRVVIRKAPEEATTLWIKTMLANITMIPK